MRITREQVVRPERAVGLGLLLGSLWLGHQGATDSHDALPHVLAHPRVTVQHSKAGDYETEICTTPTYPATKPVCSPGVKVHIPSVTNTYTQYATDYNPQLRARATEELFGAGLIGGLGCIMLVRPYRRQESEEPVVVPVSGNMMNILRETVEE